MSNRIQDILSFIDQHDGSSSSVMPSSSDMSTKDNSSNEMPTATTTTLTATSSTTTPISSTGSGNILDSFIDDKQYNAFVRKMKSKKGYPFIMNGQVFNNESEAIAFKNDILNHRKENRKMLRQQKIQNSKMKFEAMPAVDENKDSEYYEQDGMIYQIPKSPYAVVKDGVKRIIPKTSKKDTKAIAETIKKHGGKEGLKNLVKAESEDRFQELSSDIINSSSDDEVKNRYYNHVHNDFAPDKTWNRESFLNLMQQMIQMQNDVNQLKESTKPKRLQGGLNPALFKR